MFWDFQGLLAPSALLVGLALTAHRNVLQTNAISAVVAWAMDTARAITVRRGKSVRNAGPGHLEMNALTRVIIKKIATGTAAVIRKVLVVVTKAGMEARAIRVSWASMAASARQNVRPQSRAMVTVFAASIFLKI